MDEEYRVVFETNDGMQTAWHGDSLADAIYHWEKLTLAEGPDFYGCKREYEIIHVLDTSSFG